jgi:hypothetical protein
VSASGDELLRHENRDGSITYRYRADDVRDFRWSASPASAPPGPRPWPLVPLAQAVVTAGLLLAGRTRADERSAPTI